MRKLGEAERRILPTWEIVRFLLLLLLLYGMVFQEPLERKGFPIVGNVLYWLSFAALPALIWLAAREKVWRRIGVIGILCLVIFCAAGLVGYRKYEYQPWHITLFGLETGVKFWLLLVVFCALFYRFPLERWAKYLAVHVCGLSAVMVICTAADMRLWIWKRQVYRKGIGSIQIFFGHPTYFAAAMVVLLLFLLILMPYIKWVGGITVALLIYPMYMTLRIRIWGFMAVTAILILWFGILKKKMRLWLIPAGAVAGYAIGGRRFYDYYFSPYARTMARGQFAYNGIRIAKENFPFGTGFGTFGSRAAQVSYSPVYYWYEMYKTPGLDPLWPTFACDTFWPMILGETGFLGLAAYLGLTGLLVFGVLTQEKKGNWAYLAGMAAFLYELLESTGTLAFSDPTAAGIALLLGIIFGLRPKDEENG